MKAIDKKRILKKLNDIESILNIEYSKNQGSNMCTLYNKIQDVNTKAIEYLKYNYDI